MKTLFSAILVIGLVGSCHDHMHAQDRGHGDSAAAARIDGDWKLSVDTPHGTLGGLLQMKQDGSKLTGKCEVEGHGSFALTGMVDGKKISWAIEMQEGQKFTFTGTIEGHKISGAMEPTGGAWSAARILEVQNAPPKPVSGTVAGTSGNQIMIELRTAQGVETVSLTVTGKTKIRRYAPDSVKFADAIVSNTAEMATGDQIQVRGERREDGKHIAAEDVVFGTFLTRLGPITAVNREANQIQIQDVTTKKLLTIRLTADSKLKMMPDMHAMVSGKATAGGPHGGPSPAEASSRFDLQQALARLPQASIEDLKVGGAVVVTSTKGAKSDELTAIMLLANADFLVQMHDGPDSHGMSGIDIVNRMHGGMLAGPGGFSLPTMIQ